jgi:hypothetical protein
MKGTGLVVCAVCGLPVTGSSICVGGAQHHDEIKSNQFQTLASGKTLRENARGLTCSALP